MTIKKGIDHLTSWIARAFYYPRLNLFKKQPDLLQDRFYVGGKMRNIAFQPRGAGGGGYSANERSWYARRKFWIKPVEETEAFFDP